MKEQDGVFSLSFKALKLQLAALMEDVGGESGLKLMDSLANLKPEVREAVLQAFQGLLDSLNSKAELQLNDLESFEKDLYDQLLEDFKRLSGEELVTGEDVINLSDYRKLKELSNSSGELI